MAQTLPVYTNADTLDTTWASDGSTAATALLAGGANGQITRGLLTGIRFTYYDGDAAGANAVVIKLYKGNGTTLTDGRAEILGEVTINFSAEGESALWVPTGVNATAHGTEIPFFEVPYIHCNPAVANSDILITPYIRSIAGGW